MKRIDPAFGRLASAWGPAIRRAEVPPSCAETWRGLVRPPEEAGSVWPSTLPSNGVPVAGLQGFDTSGVPTKKPGLPLVLLATPPVDSSGSVLENALKAHSIAASLNARGQLRCLAVTPFRPGDLQHLLTEFQPRVMLIDIALVEWLGPEELRRVHRRLPAADWILLWQEPSVDTFELAIRTLMRGSEKWDAQPQHLERAVLAVIAGEVWFPRRAMQSLYLSLLAAMQTEGTSGPMPLDEAVAGHRSHAAEEATLTSREIEAIALMRQGLTNKQIAERLDISVNTVKKHLAHAFEKRGLHNRRQSMA